MSVEVIEAEAPARGRGRGAPTLYDHEIAQEICERIANSDKGLAHICKADSRFPTRKTVHEWLKKYPDFSDNYARAREDQADFIFDECIALADNPEIETNDKRVRIDTRKWVAGKLRPKSYGESKTLTVDANMNVQHTVIDPRQLSPEQREAISQVLLQLASENATPIIEGAALEVSDYGEDLV